MTIRFNGHPVIGFGASEEPAPPPKVSPWPMVLATSVVSAATGWAIEEIARRTIRKRKR
jgi:hypothetical protein